MKVIAIRLISGDISFFKATNSTSSSRTVEYVVDAGAAVSLVRPFSRLRESGVVATTVCAHFEELDPSCLSHGQEKDLQRLLNRCKRTRLGFLVLLKHGGRSLFTVEKLTEDGSVVGQQSSTEEFVVGDAFSLRLIWWDDELVLALGQ